MYIVNRGYFLAVSINFRVNLILIIATLTSGLFSTVFPFTNQTIATKCIDQPAAAAYSSRAGSKSVHQLYRWLLPRPRRVFEVTAIAMRFKLFATRSTKMASSVFIN